jgi:hypothetical protein
MQRHTYFDLAIALASLVLGVVAVLSDRAMLAVIDCASWGSLVLGVCSVIAITLHGVPYRVGALAMSALFAVQIAMQLVVHRNPATVVGYPLLALGLVGVLKFARSSQRSPQPAKSQTVGSSASPAFQSSLKTAG